MQKLVCVTLVYMAVSHRHLCGCRISRKLHARPRKLPRQALPQSLLHHMHPLGTQPSIHGGHLTGIRIWVKPPSCPGIQCRALASSVIALADVMPRHF